MSVLVGEGAAAAVVLPRVHIAREEHRIRLRPALITEALHDQRTEDLVAAVQTVSGQRIRGMCLPVQELIIALKVFLHARPRFGHADAPNHGEAAGFIVDRDIMVAGVVDHARRDDLREIRPVGGVVTDQHIAHGGAAPDIAVQLARRGHISHRNSPNARRGRVFEGLRPPALQPVVQEHLRAQILDTVVAIGIVQPGGDDQLIVAVLVGIRRRQLHHRHILNMICLQVADTQQLVHVSDLDALGQRRAAPFAADGVFHQLGISFSLRGRHVDDHGIHAVAVEVAAGDGGEAAQLKGKAVDPAPVAGGHRAGVHLIVVPVPQGQLDPCRTQTDHGDVLLASAAGIHAVGGRHTVAGLR